MRLDRLKLRLAEVEAERERIHKEVELLRTSWRKAASKSLWSRANKTAVSILAVAALLFPNVFHNAQSNVKYDGQPGVSVMSAADTIQTVRAQQTPDSDRKSSPRSGKKRTRYALAGTASEQQWGPLLVMAEPESGKRYYGFDPVVKSQQEHLLTLGFDVGDADGFKGPHTRRAIAEFRALYLPDSGKQLQDADLAVIMETYAELARRDAARYGIDPGVVAAIRLSSVRTGVDFSYLMTLAATESNFEPASEASTSSATGLYQFTRDTWLNTLKKHGARYGLVADYAAQIEYYQTRNGYQRPVVREPSLQQHLLALRKNPRLSAMMAAETVRDNEQRLARTFDREPTDIDLYLTHFLGADGAITFIQSLEKHPGTHAVELFPMAASSNRGIFHPQDCAPRTVDEVYAYFGEKLSARRYD
ncbi:MAG: peptidoglycan-binding domain-containing protein [Gammaproteobacteria bacterium]